jgi:hypothetical protein
VQPLKSLAKRFFPASLQTWLRRSSFYTNLQSRALAGRSKRLDLCAVEMAHHLRLAGIPSLENSVCLEVGSGWLLSHCLVLHLLGAQRVYATDIAAIAQPRHLRRAIRAAIPAVIRDQLAGFSTHALIRERLNRLASMRHFTLASLQQLGIEYVAPLDFAQRAWDPPVDFIYSVSVLEHVVVSELPLLLANLASSLRPGAHMIHAIHLEDHQDFLRQPFAFYSIPANQYGAFAQSIRGNRVRYSEWMRLFNDLEGTTTRTLFRFQREDVALPRIDSSLRHTDEADLRTSHVGTLTQRPR